MKNLWNLKKQILPIPKHPTTLRICWYQADYGLAKSKDLKFPSMKNFKYPQNTCQKNSNISISQKHLKFRTLEHFFFLSPCFPSDTYSHTLIHSHYPSLSPTHTLSRNIPLVKQTLLLLFLLLFCLFFYRKNIIRLIIQCESNQVPD